MGLAALLKEHFDKKSPSTVDSCSFLNLEMLLHIISSPVMMNIRTSSRIWSKIFWTNLMLKNGLVLIV